MVGISSPEIRNKLVPYIVYDLKPKVIFDLGMGVGLYGSQIHSMAPDIRIVGLDGWLPYLTSKFAQDAYIARIHASIEAVIAGAFPLWGDLVICLDVIEHFDKPWATRLLKVLQAAPMTAIVSTPLFDYKQGPVGGNPFEEHKCWFTEKELNAAGFATLFRERHMSHDGQKGYMGAFGG